MQIICGKCGKHSVINGSADKVDLVECPFCDHSIELNFEPSVTDEPFFAEEGELVDETGETSFAQLAQQALQERVLVICAACGSKMKIGRRLAGQKIHCVSCSKEIFIPFLDDEDALDGLEGIELKSEVLEKPTHIRRATKKVKRSSRRRLKAKRGGARTRLSEIPYFKYYVIAGAAALGVVILVSVIPFLSDDAPSFEDPGPDAGDTDTNVPDTGHSQYAGRISLVSRPQTRIFASGTTCPAMPGFVYCSVNVSIMVENKKCKLANYGSSAKLSINGGSYESLGELLDNSKIPFRAKKKEYDIFPGGTRSITLLFEIPNRSGSGRLHIDGFRDLSLDIQVLAAGKATSKSFIGVYTEDGKRNLKPLFKNKVMRAIQTDLPSRLIIRKDGTSNELVLSFPGAGVVGNMLSIKENVGNVSLKKDEVRIMCKVFLLPGAADGLILYLRDEPAHQIIYKLKSREITSAGF